MDEMTLIAVKTSATAFGLMAVIAALCAGLIRVIVTVLARSSRAPVREAPALAMPVRDDRAEVAAVIAAAVHAALPGRHRIIHLGEAPGGQDWTRESRTRLHTSHAPRR